MFHSNAYPSIWVPFPLYIVKKAIGSMGSIADKTGNTPTESTDVFGPIPSVLCSHMVAI